MMEPAFGVVVELLLVRQLLLGFEPVGKCLRDDHGIVHGPALVGNKSDSGIEP